VVTTVLDELVAWGWRHWVTPNTSHHYVVLLSRKP